MLANLLAPKVDLASLVLRLGLAAIFTVHGYFKIVQNFSMIPQLTLFEQTLLGWAEMLFGFVLAIGLFARFAALGLIILQTAAVIMVTGVHALAGPPIDAAGADFTKVGPEYNLVLVVMALAVILLGSGYLSVDYLLVKLWSQKKGVSVAPLLAAREGAAVV